MLADQSRMCTIRRASVFLTDILKIGEVSVVRQRAGQRGFATMERAVRIDGYEDV